MKKKYPAMNAPAIMKQLGQDWAKVEKINLFSSLNGSGRFFFNTNVQCHLAQVPQGKKESLVSKYEAEKVK